MSENMKTTLIFIRHGQTDWNVIGRWQGHTDVPLNEVGLSQAEALATRLENWPIDILYSSDLKRASMTATVLGKQLGKEPILDAQWRERRLGQFEGLTRAEILTQFPEVVPKDKGGIVDVPGGEEYLQVHKRASQAFEQLLERHENQTAAVVSHGGLLNSMLYYVLGLPPNDYGRISLRGNTGISIVEVVNGHRSLTRLNDTAHLENGHW